ncbi:GNAT family N-acetyltransferase [Propionivibrio soli]|uniref:GNAT family N-acetyltransferase n=1 Tax=Propionivibrio soli TaxID=2976531 RepID=UPI0021E6E2E5|nr:GNAT family N-acetyltransferase [Propionivibrio soli]
MLLRNLEPADFEAITSVVDEWWGGRPVRGLLPRLFFEHFSETSFVVVDEEDVSAFFIGFRSQTFPAVAYAHFIGVSPASRGKGYGRLLYQRFFETVSRLGCTEVRSITSPVNENSIAFHRHLGFQVLPGDGEVNGCTVRVDYAGPGQPRVLFSKLLGEKTENGSVS